MGSPTTTEGPITMRNLHTYLPPGRKEKPAHVEKQGKTPGSKNVTSIDSKVTNDPLSPTCIDKELLNLLAIPKSLEETDIGSGSLSFDTCDTSEAGSPIPVSRRQSKSNGRLERSLSQTLEIELPCMFGKTQDSSDSLVDDQVNDEEEEGWCEPISPATPVYPRRRRRRNPDQLHALPDDIIVPANISRAPYLPSPIEKKSKIILDGTCYCIGSCCCLRYDEIFGRQISGSQFSDISEAADSEAFEHLLWLQPFALWYVAALESSDTTTADVQNIQCR